MTSLEQGTVRVLTRYGAIAGGAFRINNEFLVTCRHVLVDAGAPTTGSWVTIASFSNKQAICWTGPVDASADIALLSIGDPDEEAWKEILPLSLGSAQGATGRQFSSFGYPDIPYDGLYGSGIIGPRIGECHYQVTNAHEITVGFSGCPVLDEHSRRVIGVLTDILPLDKYGRLMGVARFAAAERIALLHPAAVLKAECPYRGLGGFSPEDARNGLVRGKNCTNILDAIEARRPLVIVAAASGTGKSTMLRALLPVKAPPTTEIVVCATGQSPIDAVKSNIMEEESVHGTGHNFSEWFHHCAVHRLRANGKRHLALVIDQFEEHLANTGEGAGSPQRAGLEALDLLDQLSAGEATNTQHASTTIIVGVRVDYLGALAKAVPALLEGPGNFFAAFPTALTEDELKEIIARPLPDGTRRLEFEPGLIERVALDAIDARPHDSHPRCASATVLPLLELTLTRTWEMSGSGNCMTLSAYNKVGPVAKGLSEWASQTLSEIEAECTDVDINCAWRVLAELVEFSPNSTDGADDRSRRSTIADLEATFSDPRAARQAISYLLRHRLLAMSDDLSPSCPPSVEIIHESLLDWPAFRYKRTQLRDFLLWQRRQLETARQWQRSDCSTLPSGDELRVNIAFLGRFGDVSPLVRRMLTAALEAQLAKENSERRRRMLLQWLLVVVIFAFTAVVALASYAYYLQRVADKARFAAQKAEIEKTGSRLAALLADASRHMSARDYNAAIPLLRQASSAEDRPVSSAASSSLISALAMGSPKRWTKERHEDSSLPRLLPGTQWLAHCDGRSLVFRSTADGQVVEQFVIDFEPHAAVVERAQNGDSSTLYLSGGTGVIHRWSISAARISRASPITIRGAAEVFDIAVDNGCLAAAYSERAGSPPRRLCVIYLKEGDSVQLRADLADERAYILSVAVSSDKGAIAASDTLNNIFLWTRAGDELRRGTLTVAHSDPVFCLAFSGNGESLFSGSSDATLREINMQTGLETRRIAHPSDVLQVFPSRDTGEILTNCLDGAVRVFDFATGQVLRTIHYGVARHYKHVDVGWRGDGPSRQAIIACSNAKELCLFDVQDDRYIRSVFHGTPLSRLDYRSDLVAVGSLASTSLWIHNIGSDGHLRGIELLTPDSPINTVMFLGSDLLAVGTKRGGVEVWSKTEGVWRRQRKWRPGQQCWALGSLSPRNLYACFGPEMWALDLETGSMSLMWTAPESQDIYSAMPLSAGADEILVGVDPPRVHRIQRREDTWALVDTVWLPGVGGVWNLAIDDGRWICAAAGSTLHRFSLGGGGQVESKRLDAQLYSTSPSASTGLSVSALSSGQVHLDRPNDLDWVTVRLPLHVGPTWRSAFSEDGQLLVSAGLDGRFYLIDLQRILDDLPRKFSNLDGVLLGGAATSHQGNEHAQEK
jgi:WD40 repeat protein